MTAPSTARSLTADQRKRMRTSIDGRLVAAYLPDHEHGLVKTYRHWHCRCEPCTEAMREESRQRRHRAKQARQGQPVQQSQAAQASAERQARETEYLVDEYMFMRSYGSGHEWACARMGVDPKTFLRRLERHGLGHLCN